MTPAASLLLRRFTVVRTSTCISFLRSPPRRSFAAQAQTKTKAQIPWLMLGSLADDNGTRYLYDIAERKIAREIHLPEIHGNNCFSSSQGFLFYADGTLSDLHAVNPLTGARIPLPPTLSLPGIAGVIRPSPGKEITRYVWSRKGKTRLAKSFFKDKRVGKLSPLVELVNSTCGLASMRESFKGAILSPSLDTVVLIGGQQLVFARTGDASWTALDPTECTFHDLIFHKGRLCTIYNHGMLGIYDLDNPTAPPFVSTSRPLSTEFRLPCQRNSKRFLVESADGDDLFLVYREYNVTRAKGFRVFMLDKTTYEWNRVKSVGDNALFVGSNHSTALSARDFPDLKPNSIYFTDDHYWYGKIMQCVGDTGVFSLEDGSIEWIVLEFEHKGSTKKFKWPRPMWYMPAKY